MASPDTYRQGGHTLRSRFGIGEGQGYRILLIHVLLVAVFGIFLPWTKGLDFLDPVITAAYGCLGVLFAAPAAAQAFSDDRPASMSDALKRVATAVLYGECMTLMILLAAYMTVYVSHPRLRLTPDLGTLGTSNALGLTGSIALAALSGWMTLRFSAAVARGALRVIFLLLLVLFFFKSGWLPVVAGEAALGCLIAAGVLLLALRSTFGTA